MIETSNAYGRGLLEGIGNFLRNHQVQWSLHLVEQSRGAPVDLGGWKGDGIIARLENRKIVRAVMALGVPVVDVSSARLSPPGVPWIETDDAAIAQMAFLHLRERGYRRFAFVGDRRFNWSRWRAEAFVALASKHGHDVEVFETSQRRRSLLRWLCGLPTPVGLMAAFDPLARQVLESCREGNIAVPESLAVIGVDDDPLLCAFCSPSLTSVTPDARGAGEHAAQVLRQLMARRTPVVTVKRLVPLGISLRQSTDHLAVNDVVVRNALRFIRDNAACGLKMKDLLARSRLSRRVFESRFLSAVGRSPAEEITRCRLATVRKLLSETDLAVCEIAERAGYVHPEYLTVQFRRVFKETPMQYRSRHRVRRAR